MKSPRWGYFRIITGTIVGGILGFYVMHRAELMYKVSYSSDTLIVLPLYLFRVLSVIKEIISLMLFLIGNVESKIEEV